MSREEELEIAIDAVRIWLRSEYNNNSYIQIVHGIRSVVAWLDDEEEVEE